MYTPRWVSSLIVLLAVGQTLPALGKEDALRQAVQTIHDVDDQGQAFTLTIAALGGSGAIGLGSWLLHERPLAHGGTPAPLLFSNGIVLVGTGMGQFIHGFLRLGERRASAAAARALLDDPEATDKEQLAYLQYRADQSVSTRLVGAIVTTLQGVSVTTAGLEMALTTRSAYQTTGWVMTGLGVLGTGIGAVHFFGKTRAQRELDKAMGIDSSTASLSFELAPTVVVTPQGKTQPGIAALGRF